MEPIDTNLFRKVLSNFATGISVVTTRNDSGIAGITVNAFCSVSLEPPQVLVCIARKTNSHDLIRASGIFAVNFLSSKQEEVSRCFASTNPAKYDSFGDIKFTISKTGAPIIEGCLGYVDCKVVALYPGGDHDIFLGEVLDLGIHSGPDTLPEPLLYFRSQYTRLS